ncbi:hypothetical protein F53441_14151 [Fusarium austroafricanum]|uniref:Uncharacterized protein n=1 Tax=Fusarium austroafricanum TaxID=2364996 RepID=A0A8H4NC52_9HYPO|nr:hypothetical protein F53441_14151 [Fusarium austroafricanum]
MPGRVINYDPHVETSRFWKRPAQPTNFWPAVRFQSANGVKVGDQYDISENRDRRDYDPPVMIEWHHGWVSVSWSAVSKHPGLAAKFVDGRLKWPGPIKRVSYIITNYIQYGTYMCQNNGIEFRSYDDEQDLQEAISVYYESSIFSLRGLTRLARKEIERIGNRIPLAKVIACMANHRLWLRNNARWAEGYIAKRASKKNITSAKSDFYGRDLRTSDPLINGLIMANNNDRFPDGLLRSP